MKRGRPKGPAKESFKIRIPAGCAAKLREKLTDKEIRLLCEDTPYSLDAPASPSILPAPLASPDEMALKAQIKLLLDDNDRLQKEVDLYVVKRENWIKATPIQQVQVAMNEAERWKKLYLEGRNEFSQ